MRFQRSLVAAALAVLVIVAVAATALAASPKKGAKFKGTLVSFKAGTVSGPIKGIGRFRPPASFKTKA